MHATPQHEALLAWLRAHGASFGKLAVGLHDGERGIVAGAPIEKGERVLSVPRPLVLTLGVASASGVGQAIAASLAAADGTDGILAAFLLHERADPRSFWKPYLDMLPASLPTFPLFFEARELDLLRGSSALDTIAERRARLREEHSLLRELVPALADLSLADYSWARAVVTSRNFGVKIDGHKTRCMVPLADLLNHGTLHEVGWSWSQEREAFELRALRAVPEGAPIRNSYGAKCNRRFFVNYGFAPEDPARDEAELRLATPTDPARRRAASCPPGETARTFPIGPAIEEESIPRLLAFLRIACAAPHEVQPAGLRQGPVSLANETRALCAVAAACEQRLDLFATTLEEDEALLLDPALSSNERACIVVRRGEKRVLRRHVALATRALQILASDLLSATSLSEGQPPHSLCAAALAAVKAAAALSAGTRS